MPRDYKNRVTRRRKRRPVSPWLGMAAGLLIGVFAAAIAYFKLIAPPQQVTAPPFVPQTPEPAAVPAPPKEAKQEEKAPSPSPAKPRFDFYTILPEMEVVIPEEELTAKTPSSAFRPVEQPAAASHESAPATSTPAKPAAASASAQSQPQPAGKPATSSGGNYFLQSGTFNTTDQAERLKAQLALLGLGASVQKVTINKNTIHRVRVGPFRDYTALNAARAQMRQHGIQSTPVMIRK
jgi:cell division septation protein DedD